LSRPTGGRPPGIRNPRSLLLAEASVLVLVAFLYLPAERMWFNHLLEDCGQFGEQVRDCRYETRMRSVLGLNYTLPREVASMLRPDDVLLLPPVPYVRARLGGDACVWVEPKWFYYMAGPVRTVTTDSPRLREATCTLRFDDRGKFHLSRFLTPDALPRALQEFSRSSP